jgi:ribosomal subunit interface protein
MQIPLQITLRDIAHSPILESSIREKVAGLERSHPRITSCRVTVAGSGRLRQQSHQFDVRIDVRMSAHTEIVVNRKHDKDIYVALRDAFDSARRQLEEVTREKRTYVKAPGMR